MKNFTTEENSATITEKKEGEMNMYCNNCGKEVQADWKMCPYCGSKNEKLFTPATQEPTPAPQPTYNQPTPQPAPQAPYSQPVMQNPYGQPVYQSPYNQQSYGQPVDFNKDFMNPAQPKAKKKSKLPLIITAVVLVVAIVLGVIFVPGLIKGKEEDGGNVGDVSVNMWIINSFTCTYSDGDTERCEVAYDENGKMTSSKTYINGVCSEEINFVFNSDGRIVNETVYYDGVQSLSIDMQYDGNGNVTEIVYHDENGEESYRYEYVRDSKGRKTSEMYYFYGQLEDKYTYEYFSDTDGRLQRMNKSVAGIGQLYATEYEYNEKGLLSKETLYNNGYFYSETVYTYDSAGNCVTEVCSDADDAVATINRSFDSNGNVISFSYGVSGYHYYTYTFEYSQKEFSSAYVDTITNQQNLILEKF